MYSLPIIYFSVILNFHVINKSLNISQPHYRLRSFLFKAIDRGRSAVQSSTVYYVEVYGAESRPLPDWSYNSLFLTLFFFFSTLEPNSYCFITGQLDLVFFFPKASVRDEIPLTSLARIRHSPHKKSLLSQYGLLSTINSYRLNPCFAAFHLLILKK